MLRERAAGMSLAAAIARVTEAPPSVAESIFAGLRRSLPELQPLALRKGVLLALSRAIEDESCAQAERPLLFGSFQRERFYRQSERRWHDFARTADLAVVFADFDRAHVPDERPGGAADRPLRTADARMGGGLRGARARRLPRRPGAARAGAARAMRRASSRCSGASSPRPCTRRRRSAWAWRGRRRRSSFDRFGDGKTRLPSGPVSDQQLRLASAITTRTLRALA